MIFLKFVSNLFKPSNQLEDYIISKKPQHTGDVEHWTRRYYEGQARGL